jgi:hypothetical protein
LKASHVRKMNGYQRKLKLVVLLDKLYRLVHQLSPLNFNFPRYGPLTGAM